jgi:tol-pal system protein YbgF
MGKLFVWSLLAFVFLAGCAPRAETRDRLNALEDKVNTLGYNNVRVDLLEDRVNGLATQVTAMRAPDPPIPPVTAAQPKRIAPGGPPVRASAPVISPSRPSGQAASVRAQSGEQKEYAHALATFQAGRFEEAFRLFSVFLDAYPASSLAPNAGYWAGECEYSLKRYDRAILAFKKVVGAYPKHPKAAASMLKSGYAYEHLGDKENARFYLTALVEDFPASEPAALARQKLASL